MHIVHIVNLSADLIGTADSAEQLPDRVELREYVDRYEVQIMYQTKTPNRSMQEHEVHLTTIRLMRSVSLGTSVEALQPSADATTVDWPTGATVDSQNSELIFERFKLFILRGSSQFQVQA